jgi:hypothetical protein
MRRVLCGLGLALLAACNSSEPERIIGHWEAENFKLDGIGLPIGPQLDIDAGTLRVGGTAMSLPITRMEGQRDEVRLVVPGGVDLTFRFDSRDRMHIDLPLLGAVYYQRRAAAPAAAAPVPAPAPAPAPESATVAQPVLSPGPAALPLPATPADASFARAATLAQGHDADGALRELEQALRQGYRNWTQLDGSAPLQALRDDPRYDAMMARWRNP